MAKEQVATEPTRQQDAYKMFASLKANDIMDGHLLLLLTLPCMGKTTLVKLLNNLFGRENGIAVDLDYKAPKTSATTPTIRRMHSFLVNAYALDDNPVKLVTCFPDWLDLGDLDPSVDVVFVIPDLTKDQAVQRELKRNNGARTPFTHELESFWDLWVMNLKAAEKACKRRHSVIHTSGYVSDVLLDLASEADGLSVLFGCDED